jgi:hypothetical protein
MRVIAMHVVRGLIWGILGALVGGLAWALVARKIGGDVQWMALACGFLVGLLMRVGSSSRGGVMLGLLALALTAGSVAVGKFAEAYWTAKSGPVTPPYKVQDEVTMIGVVASEVKSEMQKQGKPVGVGRNADDPKAPLEDQFATEVWTAAKERWAEFSPEERAQRTAAHEKEVNEIQAMYAELMANKNEDDVLPKAMETFPESFTPNTWIWLGIGAVLAALLAAIGSRQKPIADPPPA